MNLPLTLVHSSQDHAPHSAGWLPSSDAIEWLKEISRCVSQGCSVAVYPVARSAEDPQAIGILLVPRERVPCFGRRVQPLREILPGVHAPMDAALSARLLENERDFFFGSQIHFFHPSLGLIDFKIRDELPPKRLIALASSRKSRWNQAVPYELFAPTLKEILINEPDNFEVSLSESGSAIGDKAGTPPERFTQLLDTASSVGKGIGAGAVLGIVGIVAGLRTLGTILTGRSIQGPNQIPLEQLIQWAEKNWKLLMDSRNREIERLMNLMEKNPDEGLRYALPLTGSAQSRGKPVPSWKLGSRANTFSHGKGGGSIGTWDLDAEARLTLERQYRAAAIREALQGNHDRAAYIYGNLLADWPNAAKALAAGGRYRDAAAVYIHKLHNRAAAARCMEDAGMLIQAAAYYTECRQFEKAGDLHAHLGNEERAHELWRLEMDAQRDPLEKARLLTRKLRDTDAALDILEVAWKNGKAPETAVQMIFSIHHAQENQKAMLGLFDRIFHHESASFPLVSKLRTCHKESIAWNDDELSAALEREAYQRIGSVLCGSKKDARELLRFLPDLDKSDELLGRDSVRFTIGKVPLKAPTPGPPQGTKHPDEIVTISAECSWDSISTLPQGVSIAGYGKEMMAVAQLREVGCHSSALRTTDDPGKTKIAHLVVSSARGNSRLFHFRLYKQLHYRALDRVRTDDDDALGTLRDVLAVGPNNSEGDFALLQHNETSSLNISIYSEMAELRRTIPIGIESPEVKSMNWLIAGKDGHFCIAANNMIAWRYPDGKLCTMSLEANSISLHLSPLSSVQEALLSVGNEVILINTRKSGKDLETINLHSDPNGQGKIVSCYLPDGSIAIAGVGGGVIYPPNRRNKACAYLHIPSDIGVPIDICPRGPGGFVILTSAGKLAVFKG